MSAIWKFEDFLTLKISPVFGVDQKVEKLRYSNPWLQYSNQWIHMVAKDFLTYK